MPFYNVSTQNCGFWKTWSAAWPQGSKLTGNMQLVSSEKSSKFVYYWRNFWHFEINFWILKKVHESLFTFHSIWWFFTFFSALNSFVLQSQKFDAQIQCGSHVAKAWSVFVEETDRMSKNVKESADSMATTILEKLNSLYTVRKKKTF